jgi:hypothetical protein
MTNPSQGGWIVSPGWFAAATIRGAERNQGATVTSGHALAVRSSLATISPGRSSSARRMSKTLPPGRDDLTRLLERSSRDVQLERAEQNLDWAQQPNVSCWHDLFRQDSLCSKQPLRSSEMARCVKKATSLRPPRSSRIRTCIRCGQLIHERSKSNDNFACSLTIVNNTIERLPDLFQI